MCKCSTPAVKGVLSKLDEVGQQRDLAQGRAPGERRMLPPIPVSTFLLSCTPPPARTRPRTPDNPPKPKPPCPCHPVYNNRHFPSAPPFPPCPAPHPAPIIQPPDQLRHPQSTSMVWSNTSPPPLRGVPVITDPHLQRPLGCKLAPPKDDIYDDANLPAWAGGDDPRLINVQISNAAIEIKNCTRPGEVRCSSVYKAIISIDAGDIKRSAVAPMTVVGQSGDGVGGAEGAG